MKFFKCSKYKEPVLPRNMKSVPKMMKWNWSKNKDGLWEKQRETHYCFRKDAEEFDDVSFVTMEGVDMTEESMDGPIMA